MRALSVPIISTSFTYLQCTWEHSWASGVGKIPEQFGLQKIRHAFAAERGDASHSCRWSCRGLYPLGTLARTPHFVRNKPLTKQHSPSENAASTQGVPVVLSSGFSLEAI